MISRLDASGRKQQAQLDLISDFARHHDVPRALRAKMVRYATFLYSVNGGFDVQAIQALSAAMPPTVSAELFLSLHEGLVRAVPVFSGTDESFVRALVVRLRTQAVLEGDYVFYSGDPGETMYFITVGLIEILSPAGVLLTALGSGHHFGELAMLTAQPRLASARAAVDTLLHSIGLAAFDEVVVGAATRSCAPAAREPHAPSSLGGVFLARVRRCAPDLRCGAQALTCAPVVLPPVPCHTRDTEVLSALYRCDLGQGATFRRAGEAQAERAQVRAGRGRGGGLRVGRAS